MTDRGRIEEGERRRDTAIDRVERGASDEWVSEAEAIVRAIIATLPEFTTDDVWDALERRGIPSPREPRALGAVIRRFALMGACENTDRVQKSRRPECHRRPVAVWRSR